MCWNFELCKKRKTTSFPLEECVRVTFRNSHLWARTAFVAAASLLNQPLLPLWSSSVYPVSEVQSLTFLMWRWSLWTCLHKNRHLMIRWTVSCLLPWEKEIRNKKEEKVKSWGHPPSNSRLLKYLYCRCGCFNHSPSHWSVCPQTHVVAEALLGRCKIWVPCWLIFLSAREKKKCIYIYIFFS